jgi:DNA-binding beta-propeller fold protein YncE
VIKTFDKEGKIDRTPLNFTTESDKVAQSLLYFPGKVLADGPHNRLFISDTDHNRIVIATLNGEVKAVAGNGKAALKDGSYTVASFNQPQGLTRIGDKLYVSDTGNNAIRVIDLSKQTVKTLAGNGQQARRFNVSGYGKKVKLNSPWDITHVHDTLYVAMAGSHQVWKINPHTGFAEPFAGSGREGLQEGRRRNIPMAQPSGITTDGTYLYVAEPEASAVQRIGLGKDKQVKTIVGKGLFVFGDKDGSRRNARLQHDLVIAYWNGKLLVADTYNNKIKEINPKTGRTSTFLGSGKGGYKDGTGKKAAFDEPGGLSVAKNWLYIADTDNHLIRKVNLKTRKVATLQLTNLSKLKVPQKSNHPQRMVALPPQPIASDAHQVSFTLTISDPYHFNRQAPNQFILSFSKPAAAFGGEEQDTLALTKTNHFPLTASVDLNGKQPQALYADVYAYFCRNGQEALCRYTSYRYKIPLKYSENGKEVIKINQQLQIPKLSAGD